MKDRAAGISQCRGNCRSCRRGAGIIGNAAHLNDLEREHAALTDAAHELIAAEASVAWLAMAEAGGMFADFAVEERPRAISGKKWFEITAQFGIAPAAAAGCDASSAIHIIIRHADSGNTRTPDVRAGIGQ